MKPKKQNIATWLLMAGIAFLAMGAGVYASSNTDNRIESAAKNTYVFQTYLKDDSIDVKSKNGVVTLTGTVAGPSHKSLAAETVGSLPGVKKVNNKLLLASRNDEENKDSWIETEVKMTLLFHRNVNAFNTQVQVKDGTVTLQGEADSAAQKDLTTAYAKDIIGVKSVTNNTVVRSQEKPKELMSDKIDDASITAQVKMALLYHRSTSALKTKVTTLDGVVQLSGKARNAAEKDLVTKLVNDINGVRNVQNSMTIPLAKKS